MLHFSLSLFKFYFMKVVTSVKFHPIIVKILDKKIILFSQLLDKNLTIIT